ncbi:DUF4283 domain-containing protein, partial [Cephalotus follicularis]
DFEFDDESDKEEEDNGHDPSIPVILLSKEENLRIRSSWIHCLIVKVFERSVGYHYLLSKIHQIWHPKEDFSFVLTGGPWFIGLNFLAIRHWEPELRASVALITMTAVWIRLVELPLEFFYSSILSKIGNKLGTILRINPHTLEVAMGRLARLCIQIVMSNHLVSRIRIGKYLQSVQYKGISSICFCCECIGHKKDSCP